MGTALALTVLLAAGATGKSGGAPAKSDKAALKPAESPAPIHEAAVPAAESPAPAASPAAKRVKVAVMDFDYGTVTDHWWGDADIGKGMADQVVDGLVNDGTVSVFERKKLDTALAEQDFARSDRASPSAATLAKIGKVQGVKYIVTGSITKFSSERKNFGAGAAGAALGPIGMLGFKKAKTEVGLTLRLVDTTTGEVVLSAQGKGVSKKGGGLSVGAGKFGSGGSAFNMASDDYRGSAIGEAQEKACGEVVQAVLEKLASLQ
jgi:curli biogenesis system outer membrane secretion channel CsgG